MALWIQNNHVHGDKVVWFLQQSVITKYQTAGMKHFDATTNQLWCDEYNFVHSSKKYLLNIKQAIFDVLEWGLLGKLKTICILFMFESCVKLHLEREPPLLLWASPWHEPLSSFTTLSQRRMGMLTWNTAPTFDSTCVCSHYHPLLPITSIHGSERRSRVAPCSLPALSRALLLFPVPPLPPFIHHERAAKWSTAPLLWPLSMSHGVFQQCGAPMVPRGAIWSDPLASVMSQSIQGALSLRTISPQIHSLFFILLPYILPPYMHSSTF